MAGRGKREIRDQDVQGLKFLRKIRPLLSRLRKVGTERDTAGNRRLFMDEYCSLILMSLLSPGKPVRIDATSANPKGDADERAVLKKTIEADRCYILNRGSISYGLWNAINAKGSSYVCRASDKTAATVTHANDLTEADRTASVISDEIVELGWKSKHRTRPDHPVRLICVAVKPHESSRGWKGPHCDGVLRLVTNRLDLPAELIAEMVRLRASVLRQAQRRGDPGVLRHDRVHADPDLYRGEAESGDVSDGLVLPDRPRESQGTRGLHRITEGIRDGVATALVARGVRCCAVGGRCAVLD